jgi:hypothetical protein
MTDLYDAWEVRTPYPLTDTFNGAKARIQAEAADNLKIQVIWRKGRGQSRHKDPRFHFWEVRDETDAMLFMLAYGDRMYKKTYPIKGAK